MGNEQSVQIVGGKLDIAIICPFCDHWDRREIDYRIVDIKAVTCPKCDELFDATMPSVNSACDRLKAEVERYKKALEHYAGGSVWSMSSGHRRLYDLYQPDRDGFAVARMVLAIQSGFNDGNTFDYSLAETAARVQAWQVFVGSKERKTSARGFGCGFEAGVLFQKALTAVESGENEDESK